MLKTYELQLNEITNKLNSYFKEQKDYIKCKIGCGYCCSNAYYPISNIEYDYIKKGINLLFSKEDIKELNEKVWEIYKNRQIFIKNNSNIHDFAYTCPFNKENSCTIYEYRPILCRTYGLISIDTSLGKENLPYCINLNLNYANIWDYETSGFSNKKIKELEYKTMPKAYDVSYSSLIKAFTEVDFKEIRMLYEWIILDIPDYQNIMDKIKKY
ncbi:MAG: YkgJ family cysteine cluster protein [bacterium]